LELPRGELWLERVELKRRSQGGGFAWRPRQPALRSCPFGGWEESAILKRPQRGVRDGFRGLRYFSWDAGWGERSFTFWPKSSIC